MTHTNLHLRSTTYRPVLGTLALLFTQCLTPEPPQAMDAGPPVDSPPPLRTVQDIRVRDDLGRPWPLDAAPWHPTFELTAPHAEAVEAWLFQDTTEEAIREDISRPPLRVAHRDRAVPLSVESDGHTWRVRPSRTLEPGSYVLALPAWGDTLDVAFVISVEIAVDGGALLSHTWPPAESSAVPMTMETLLVRFSGAVTGPVSVRGSEGAIAFDEDTFDCLTVGWPSGDCRSLRLDGPMRPAARYVIDARAMRDGAGRALEEFASFHTIAEAPLPTPRALSCVVDEVPLPQDAPEAPSACVVLGDDRLVFRTHYDGPIRLRISTPWSTSTRLAPRGEASISLPDLRPGTSFAMDVTAVSLDGRVQASRYTLATHSPLPAVYINEVRANPAGAEPYQEYVELFYDGDTPLHIEGWRLSDARDREGDRLSGVLLPQSHVLVVSDRFDAMAPEDEPVPAGTPLWRIGTSLGSGGLTNRGEPLFLRDQNGVRIDAFPARDAYIEGHCWHRSGTGRDAMTAIGPCSPGSGSRP